MAKLPPPAVVMVAEAARTGLDVIKLNLVPAPIALLDLVTDSVPEGADCYISKSAIHDWGDDDAAKILANIRGAMAPAARVVLYEAIMGARNQASFAKLLDLEMVVNAPGGRERTLEEYRALFARAGLKLERVVQTAGPMSILEALAQ